MGALLGGYLSEQGSIKIVGWRNNNIVKYGVKEQSEVEPLANGFGRWMQTLEVTQGHAIFA